MTAPPPCVRLATHGEISVVTLDRPERLNAIGGTLLDDLHAALLAAHADEATAAIVLTGAGRAFCAGDDLKEFAAQSADARSIEATCTRIQQITRDLMGGPKLVVGAAHGYAVGGGFEWMLNCDLVVAADDLIAFFPEMALGHFVTGGVTLLLPQALGWQRAMELLLLGDRLDASQLLALGLVNRVVPRARLLDEALALAQRVASRAPQATRRLKRVMGEGVALQAALARETLAAQDGFASDETARRIAAFARSR